MLKGECILMADVECDGYVLGECINCPYFKDSMGKFEANYGKSENGSVSDGEDLQRI